MQPAKDECRNKGMEYGRRYVATNVSQLTQGGKAAYCDLMEIHKVGPYAFEMG